jgi:hypothetical protein
MSYLEQCVYACSTVDPDLLGDMSVGEILGHGSGFDTHCLGRLTIGGEVQHVALKIPTVFLHRVDARVINDISLSTILTNRVPSLRPMLPTFVGVLALGEKSRAIITEDASAGGQYGVEQQACLPDDIEGELFDAFAWAGSPNEVFDISTLRRTTAFDVNGKPRILDLMPPPFKNQFRKWPEYLEVRYAAEDWLQDVTVSVRPNSTLAASINDFGLLDEM